MPEVGAAIASVAGPGTLLGSALALPEAVGGALAGPLAGIGTAIGIPSAIATPLAGFLSPEIIGGGLGEAFGGTKGLEEGLLAGATMGGGLGSFGNLLDTGLSSIGAPGLGQTVGGLFTDPFLGSSSAASAALQAAGPAIQTGIQGQPSVAPPPPQTNITAPTQGNTVGAAPPGGPSGLSLTGNTAPQVGPWLSNFWGNNTGSAGSNTGNVPTRTSAAPATSSAPSATNQQQLVAP